MTSPVSLPFGSTLGTSRDDFLEVLRMLAHRLSQPLTSLRGSVEVTLMGEVSDPECRRVLEITLQESHRMAETLDALRDVLETEGTCEEVNPISWTQSVEKLLEDVELVDKDYLVSDLQAEVWVKASPQHLHTATARLVGGAVRVAHQKRVVRIDLSIQDETGCLSVCEEGLSPDAKYGASASEPFLPSEPLKLGTLDEWIVRRAIERQGGWLKIGRTFGTASCYQLNLPLAISRATGKM